MTADPAKQRTPSTQASERPCIWVAAGVLSYRLCDRDYDCEHCELHRALAGHSDLASGGVGEGWGERGLPASDRDPLEDQIAMYVRRLLIGCTLHLDRYYSVGHFWLEPLDDGDVLAGLDPQVRRVMCPIDHLTTPQVGVWLKRGDPCGWITRGRMSVSLSAPVSGEVADVRRAQGEEGVPPRESRAQGNGWLLRIRPHESLAEVPELLQGERALQWHLQKILLIKQHLRGAMLAEPSGELGPTLADGGAVELDLAQVLGRERFETLVQDLFQMHI